MGSIKFEENKIGIKVNSEIANCFYADFSEDEMSRFEDVEGEGILSHVLVNIHDIPIVLEKTPISLRYELSATGIKDVDITLSYEDLHPEFLNGYIQAVYERISNLKKS